VLVLVGIVVAVVAFRATRPAAEVETVPVEVRDLAVTVTASGRVESSVRADVFPPTAGLLASVRVTDGQRVTAGTVLAVLDTGPLEIAVAQAEAGLAQAEAGLVSVDDQAPTSADVAAARAATDAARAAYRSAQAGAGAVSSQAPSQSDIDAAVAATAAAKSAYDQAVKAYDAAVAAQGTPTPPGVELPSPAAAALARDQAYAAYLRAESAESQLGSVDLSSQQSAADAGVEQAHAAYLGAKAQQEKLEDLDLSPQRRAARAAVEQARQGLALATDNLAKAELVAPIDGVVLFNALGTPSSDGALPKAAAGVGVAPQAAPFTIVALDATRFTAEVDEADVELVEAGMNATVRLDAFADRSFETTVSEVRPAATLTPTGGTVFPVYLRLAGLDANVLLGMRGDATIEVSRAQDVTTVPVEALFDEAGETVVYVVQDGRLVRTPVQVGAFTETAVEILSGVPEGAEVALSSATEFEDGMAVRVQGQ
jgi:RND family efflux transporter MFP subunit